MGGPLLQPAFPCARLPVTGHSGKPFSSVALQVFLVLDSDLLPGERDDFVLGVSSGAPAGLWSCQLCQGLSSEEEEQGGDRVAESEQRSLMGVEALVRWAECLGGDFHGPLLRGVGD